MERKLMAKSLLWGEDEGDDETVKTQYFSENKDKDHTDEQPAKEIVEND